MLKQGKKHRIYLSGGGNEQQAFELEEAFFADLKKQARLLYLPLALKGHDLYASAPVWIRGLADMHQRQDIEITTWDSLDDRTLADLSQYDALFVGGGNTWSLMRDIRESKFDQAINKYLQQGGSIYGGSAGAIILGDRIDTQNDDNLVGWKDDEGLKLLDGLSIACHYKASEMEHYRAWSIKHHAEVICLAEESGIIISGGHFTFINKSHAQLFDEKGERPTF